MYMWVPSEVMHLQSPDSLTVGFIDLMIYKLQELHVGVFHGTEWLYLARDCQTTVNAALLLKFNRFFNNFWVCFNFITLFQKETWLRNKT